MLELRVKVTTKAGKARLTNKTTAGQMVGRGRIRNAARHAMIQAKDGTQARAVGKNCGNGEGRSKDWNGNGKGRTDGMTGSRLRGKARAARNAAAGAVYTVLTKPVTANGGHSQKDHSPAHNQKKKFTSAC